MCSNRNWIFRLIQAKNSSQALVKVAREYEQDQSLAPLEELRDQGYDTVELTSPNSACQDCRDVADERELGNWLSGLQHSAPIFEWTHPGCSSCYLIVSDSNGELPSKIVNRNGTVEDL